MGNCESASELCSPQLHVSAVNQLDQFSKFSPTSHSAGKTSQWIVPVFPNASGLLMSDNGFFGNFVDDLQLAT